MNKRQDFLNKPKSKTSSKLFTLTTMSLLLAACKTNPTPTPTPTPTTTNISNNITINADTLSLIDNGKSAIIDALAGNDTITGGDKADFIRGNTGADIIKGGAGVDNIIVIGTTEKAQYTQTNIQNPNGTGIDLSALLKLDTLNNNTVSDLAAGEIIDGGADGARLFVYGNTDFTTSTLSNITRIDVQSKLTITATQLKTLLTAAHSMP